MSSLECLRIGRLLDRRAGGLTEAERLVLEEHLVSCRTCRADSVLLEALRRLVNDAGPAPLGPGGHERAIRRVFEGGAAVDAPGELRLRTHSWMTAGPAAILTAGALALVVFAWAGLWAKRAELPSQDPPAAGRSTPPRSLVADPPSEDEGAGGALERAAAWPTPLPSSPAADPPEDEVIGGDLDLNAKPAAAGEAIAPGATFRTRGGARIRLGRAQVTLAAATAGSWDKASELLTLSSGAAEFEVGPAHGKSFRAANPRFVVEVIGTRFWLGMESVRVTRGAVRVLSSDGSTLAAAVPAGAEFPARSKAPSVSALLAAARARLARRGVAEARDRLNQLLRRPLRAADEAEARSLLAECALVEGDRARAARLYLEVGRRFDKLPAGDTALFAAARLETAIGNTQVARELLEEYLRRHPEGRFARDAANSLGLRDRP